jgi:transmembrane protein EpsG
VSLLGIAVLFAYIGNRNIVNNNISNKVIIHKNIFLIISISLIILISGLRNDSVGVDSEDYRAIYEYSKLVSTSSIDEGRFEIGFSFITNEIARIDLSYTYYFTILSIITWLLFIISLPENGKNNYLFIFFMFTTGFYFFSFNAIRQIIAILLFSIAINNAISKRKLFYFGFIMLGSLFHYSILYLLPIYYLLPYIKFSQKQWTVFILLAAILGLFNTTDYFFPFLKILPGNLERYFYSNRITEIEGISFSLVFHLVISLIILDNYKKIIKTFPEALTYINLYFLGIIVYNLFSRFLLLNRVGMYFYYFEIYALTYLYQYYSINKYSINKYFLLGVYSLIYVYRIINNDSGCFPYTFAEF